MATLNFSDRFSYPSPNGISSAIDNTVAAGLSDADIEANSPELQEMVAMIRRYSVLLQRTPVYEIYSVITSESDPRIALVLSAAKSRLDNKPIFGGLNAIKEIMYADPQRPGLTRYTNRDLFSDGIRRVSAALTAARIIGQLAQVREQAEHAALIENQALADLDRIVQTWETTRLSDLTDQEKEELPPAAFYFEPGTWDIPTEKTLTVEWQSPSIQKDWTTVAEYTGTVETWQIVNAIVDDINSKSITHTDSPLLAAAELSGEYAVNVQRPNESLYHLISFYPRRPTLGTLAYSINLRIQTQLNEGETDTSTATYPINRTPFIWGHRSNALDRYNTNGAIIVIRNNKVTSNASEAEDYQSSVIYFKNKVNYIDTTPPPSDDKLIFRIEPWQPNMSVNSPEDEQGEETVETIEIPIPRLTSTDSVEQLALDNNRYSQVALAILNGLAELNLDTRISGALIRNDPDTSAEALAALEIVPWAKQRVITAVVLDILRVPSDIEIATGNESRVLTQFSSKPRSVMVKNPQSDSANGVVDAVMRKEQTHVIKRRRPNLWTAIVDEAEKAEQRGWS
jgi:hypothetical protein